MADAEDLKSSGPKGRAGSSPALGTSVFNDLLAVNILSFYPPTTFWDRIGTGFSIFRPTASTARRFPSSVAVPAEGVGMLIHLEVFVWAAQGQPGGAVKIYGGPNTHAAISCRL